MNEPSVLANFFDARVLGLMALLLMLVLAGAYQEWQRHKLRGRLGRLSVTERQQLAAREPEVRFSRPHFQGKSYIVTMLAGQAFVNVPVVMWVGAPLMVIQRWFDPDQHPVINLLAVLAGFFAAWLWWSVSVSIWRWWAMRYRAMSAGEVQWRGQQALLLWGDSSRLAKTAWYARRGKKKGAAAPVAQANQATIIGRDGDA